MQSKSSSVNQILHLGENKSLEITESVLQLVRFCLKQNQVVENSQKNLMIEKDILLSQTNSLFENHINFNSNNINFNSTNEGVPKYLHWFEWEKREIHLFDVVDFTHSMIKLIIPFKIPAFSRSIMIPDGRIYLMGGED